MSGGVRVVDMHRGLLAVCIKKYKGEAMSADSSTIEFIHWEPSPVCVATYRDYTF
jgi:hypothetical protein